MFGISYFFPLGNSDQGRGVEPLFKISYTSIDDKGELDAGLTLGQDVWEIVVGGRLHLNKHAYTAFNWVMYDLEQMRAYTNKESSSPTLIHAFLFQFVARW
jgi:hypothetical protein